MIAYDLLELCHVRGNLDNVDLNCWITSNLMLDDMTQEACIQDIIRRLVFKTFNLFIRLLSTKLLILPILVSRDHYSSSSYQIIFQNRFKIGQFLLFYEEFRRRQVLQEIPLQSSKGHLHDILAYFPKLKVNLLIAWVKVKEIQDTATSSWYYVRVTYYPVESALFFYIRAVEEREEDGELQVTVRQLFLRR